MALMASASTGYPRYEYYKSNGQFYWRYRSSNVGEIIASGQGYSNKSDCLHAIELLKASAKVPVTEVDK